MTSTANLLYISHLANEVDALVECFNIATVQLCCLERPHLVPIEVFMGEVLVRE